MKIFIIKEKWNNYYGKINIQFSFKKSDISKIIWLPLLITPILFVSCSPKSANKDFEIDVYQTSYAGDNLKLISSDEARATSTGVKKVTLQLLPNEEFQKYYGFGASFTESSAWNLATIPVEMRKKVLTKMFSPTEGAGFTLTRTHINSSDYSNNHYTYIDEGDEDLSTFSIHEDMKGFTGEENDQVRGIELIEPNYDLIPMILEASSIGFERYKSACIVRTCSPILTNWVISINIDT